MTTEIVHVENEQTDLVQHLNWTLEEGRSTLQKLKSVIKDQHSGSQSFITTINGSEHLRFEAWQFLARQLSGGKVHVENVGEPRKLEGYRAAYMAQARVFCILPDVSTVQLSNAYAQCGTTGDGAWEKRNPEPQCLSMAQTRAMVKALAIVFRWVPVLEGWSGTPYEEMGKESTTITVESNDSPDNYSKPMATSAQQSFIKSLGYEGDVSQLTKSGASEIIEKLKSKKDSPEDTVVTPIDTAKEYLQTPKAKVMDMKELGELIIDIQATPDNVNKALGLNIPPSGRLGPPIQDYIAEDPENRSCWVVACTIVDSMING